MITYEAKQIEIKQDAESSTFTPAQVASNGLAYHLTNYNYTNHIGPDYSVTHIATGRIIGEVTAHFENETQCQRFIELIDPLMDWHKSMHEMFSGFTSLSAKQRWMEKTREAIKQAALQASCFEVVSA